MFFPFRDTVNQAFFAILPRNDHIISLEEIHGLEALRLDLKEGFPAIMRVLLSLIAVCLWQMTPRLTIGRWRRATTLDPATRDTHTNALLTSRYYLVRHAMTLLKAFAMLHWGRSNTVRTAVGLPVYGTDPKTCRESADIRHARHLSFHSRYDTPEDVTVDIIIVGSGPGAVACADRIIELTGKHHSIAFVEAGAYRQPSDYPYTTLGAMRDMFDEQGTVAAFGRSISTVLAGRVVGGGSVVNSGIIVETPDDIFDEMRHKHGIFYRNRAAISNTAGRILDHEARFAQALRVGSLPDLSIGEATRRIKAAAKRLELFDHDVKKNMPGCLGSGQCLQGCRAGKKQSLDRWITRMLEKDNVFLLSSSPVEKIIMKRGRATGVTGRFIHPITRERGARFTVHARHAVVLSASAIGTPTLLSRSAIRLPMVGKGFIAHPGSPMQAVYPNGIRNVPGSTQDFASLIGRDRGFKLETCRVPEAEVASGRFPGSGRRFAAHLADLDRSVTTISVARGKNSEGSVHSLPGGQRLIRYSIASTDIETIRAGLYEWARIHFEAGAERVYPGIYGTADIIYPGEEDLILKASTDPRAYTTVISHLMGGARMGLSKDQGVCDEQGKVFETENLFIADSSILPITLGVNPQLTIMGFAAHVAEEILRFINT